VDSPQRPIEKILRVAGGDGALAEGAAFYSDRKTFLGCAEMCGRNLAQAMAPKGRP
jgi:hypothetical protein